MTNDRPQDVGRVHVRSQQSGAYTTGRKRRSTVASAAALIERWRAVERMTLERVTTELEGVDKGTGLDGTAMPREYPSVSATAGLIDLGVKIARDLGTDIDPDPLPDPPPALARPRRTRKLDV